MNGKHLKQTLILSGLIFILFFCETGWTLEKCQICHSKKDIHRTEETGRKIPLFVDESILGKSVHSERECTDCHADIVEIPHKKPKKVNCKRCHYEGNPVGAPEGQLYDQFEHSVHGMAVMSGNDKAPVCQDCHGNHDVIIHTDSTSKMYWQNIPKTCGSCHIEIYATYKESVHGVAVANGVKDSPVCSGCHGEHNIRSPKEDDSRVSQMRISQTCSECHGEKGVVSKYGIKTDRSATFEHSFHGVAQQMGNRTVANCASCHGYHDVRKEDDPKSSINPANIKETCGSADCHPTATAEFASGQIHINPKSEESGILYYISKFFLILTVSTLIGLFIFILMDLFRRAKTARQKRHGK
ncbi:MAG: hypothetical protein DWP97_07910 [Calditrichaeota bacterium]|nr:MAG: hypothetical protein DWP97_07910 [Calditrichota bacterium]